MDVLGVFVASWRQWFLPIDGIVGAIHRDHGYSVLMAPPSVAAVGAVELYVYCTSRAAVRAATGTTLTRFVSSHTLHPGCGHPASCAHSVSHPSCMCALAASQSHGCGCGGVWFNFGAQVPHPRAVA